MSNPTLIKTFTAGGAVPAYRMVKHGATDGSMVLATASTDSIVGIYQENFDVALGEPIEVVLHGTADVQFGGTVTRGAMVTCDASGKAVAAAPAAGVNARIVGISMVSAVAGDIGQVLLAQGSAQG